MDAGKTAALAMQPSCGADAEAGEKLPHLFGSRIGRVRIGETAPYLGLLRLLGQFPHGRHNIEKLVGNSLAHMLGIIANRVRSEMR